MKTERKSWVVFYPAKGQFVKNSAPLSFTGDFQKAKMYKREGDAKVSIRCHKKNLEGAVIVDVVVRLDPQDLFVHLLMAGK